MKILAFDRFKPIVIALDATRSLKFPFDPAVDFAATYGGTTSNQ